MSKPLTARTLRVHSCLFVVHNPVNPVNSVKKARLLYLVQIGVNLCQKRNPRQKTLIPLLYDRPKRKSHSLISTGKHQKFPNILPPVPRRASDNPSWALVFLSPYVLDSQQLTCNCPISVLKSLILCEHFSNFFVNPFGILLQIQGP